MASCCRKYNNDGESRLVIIDDGSKDDTYVIISIIYAKKKLSVKYIPIIFLPRQGGVNSINLKKINKIGIKALKDFRMINKEINKSK